ncbi:hypothetical protein RND71_035200 [Anisodus tanguticus]|uniref:Uncharacterized protein n=1 Tax=Anisodus tanguticus TaxID=243964 RepID=A0AAE1V1D4_9SOLA|nr:hypothetical protein RND71_035200 [Anisodus tanguticus]
MIDPPKGDQREDRNLCHLLITAPKQLFKFSSWQQPIDQDNVSAKHRQISLRNERDIGTQSKSYNMEILGQPSQIGDQILGSTLMKEKMGNIFWLLKNHVLKDFAMVVIGETIYVIGGRQCYKDLIDSSQTNNVHEIDTEVVPSVLKYNTSLGGAMGTSLAEVYDPVLDQWKQLPTMSTTRYR